MSADESPRDDVQEEVDGTADAAQAGADAPEAGADEAGGTADSDTEAVAGADESEEPDESDEVDEADEIDDEVEEAPAASPRPAWRTPALAATRAVVVAAVAVVGYLLVVPQTHVDRNRLAQLIIPETGISTFPGKAPQSQGEPVPGSGINSLEALNKTHPDATGIWVSQWAGTGQSASDLAAVVVVDTPSSADATKVLGDLRPQTVDRTTTGQSYTRSATFTASGVPGSQGALFASGAAQAGQPSRLASILWQQGKVVSIVEEAADANTQAQAQSMTQREAALLRSDEPGFSQKVTTYPTGPTIAWAAVAAAVLILFAGGPVLFGRRRRRRDAERQALLEAQVRGHSAIAKRRRTTASPGGRAR